jgi:hypothetical protein
VTARVSGGTGNNTAVSINSASAAPHPLILRDVTAEATGGAITFGIRFTDCQPTLTNITASASGGSIRSYGVFDNNDAGGMPTIENSVISGETGALLSSGFGSVHIANTRLVGGVDVTGDPGNPPPVCAGVYNGDFDFFASTCP